MWERPNDPDLRRAARARDGRFPADPDPGRRQAQAQPEQGRPTSSRPIIAELSGDGPVREPGASPPRCARARDTRGRPVTGSAHVGTIIAAHASPAPARDPLPTRARRRAPRGRGHRRHRPGGRAAAPRASPRRRRRVAHPGPLGPPRPRLQWALAAQREPLGARDGGRARRAIMADAADQPDGRRVGIGFRDALWADAPTLDVLDAATGDIPTYLINADVHSVWLNTAALRREGFEPDGVGFLREEPAFEISRRLNAVDAAVARSRSSRRWRGMPQPEVSSGSSTSTWPGTRRRGRAGSTAGSTPCASSSASTRSTSIARSPRGCAPGDPVRGAASDLARVGSLKVITDGSLGTRTAACSHAYPGDPHNHGLLDRRPRDLVELMTRGDRRGLASAIHAIGDIANSHALDAFAADRRGGHDRARAARRARRHPAFGRLGCRRASSPSMRSTTATSPTRSGRSRRRSRTRCAALADTGANLLFGSDAPVSPLDPWAAIAAAVFRTRDGREPWQPRAGRGCRDRPRRIDSRRLDRRRAASSRARAPISPLCATIPSAPASRAARRCASRRLCSPVASPT